MSDIKPIETSLSGYELLATPRLNKGTAFTDAERDMFELHGLLPPNIATLQEQVERRLEAFRAFETDIERYAFLRDLQDTNETLFYALLLQHIEELLPIVYTPTVGAGCQQFSRLFRRPRGLFISIPHKARMDAIFAQSRFDGIETIVVTDGERILGLGDQGAGGMGIPIGKLALYSACGGIDPAKTLPILLDVGTDNQDCLDDPLYIGWRNKRVRGQEYDDFVESFVAAVKRRWPKVLLQWEDFAKNNATRFLERYRGQLCTFNDDVQGTAAVATGALLSAVNVSGVKLTEQRVAIFGAGSAGCGIANLIRAAMRDAGLTDEEAGSRFFLVDKDGLLVEGMTGLASFQLPFLQGKAAVAGWKTEKPGFISLLDTIHNARPTALIGVSGQAGAFTEAVVRAMAENNKRPAIFPLSNPTSREEAAPEDIEAWSGGRALIGVGSPFPPITRNGAKFKVDQSNNSYIFPGVGLGALAAGAGSISDGMFMAAAKALAEESPAKKNPNGNLLPPVTALRDVAVTVAIAVARQARAEGLATVAGDIEQVIREKVWNPVYAPYRRIRA